MLPPAEPGGHLRLHRRDVPSLPGDAGGVGQAALRDVGHPRQAHAHEDPGAPFGLDAVPDAGRNTIRRGGLADRAREAQQEQPQNGPRAVPHRSLPFSHRRPPSRNRAPRWSSGRCLEPLRRGWRRPGSRREEGEQAMCHGGRGPGASLDVSPTVSIRRLLEDVVGGESLSRSYRLAGQRPRAEKFPGSAKHPAEGRAESGEAGPISAGPFRSSEPGRPRRARRAAYGQSLSVAVKVIFPLAGS